MRIERRLAVSALLLCVTNAHAGEAMTHESCLAAVEKTPEDAFENAMIWRDSGGGIDAEHCVAMAYLALGHPGEAAVRFDALARREDAGTTLRRADLLGQSGNAWLLARQPVEAEAAFSAALKLAPGDAQLWADRGRAKAARRDWRGAESDLSEAITFNNRDPQLYVLRAAARHAQSKAAEARVDIDAALRINPNHPEALVERGSLRLAAGDRNGARADWIAVLRQAPKSAAADAARDRIAAMEIRAN